MPRPLPDWRADADALRPFTSIRLIAVDLDGTFVRAHSSTVLDQLQRLQAGLYASRQGRPGVRVTYATGRSLTSVSALLRELRNRLPARTPLVLYNGSVVIEAGTGAVLRRATFSAAAFAELRALTLRNHGAIYGYSGPVDTAEPDRGEHVVAWTAGPARHPTDVNGAAVEWPASLEPLSFEPVAALVLLDSPVVLGRVAEAARTVPGVSLTRSGAEFLEVRPVRSDKAAGLQVVIDRLDLRREQVLALGDSDNDIEMLEWAGIAVSVSGASARAAEVSDYVASYGAAEAALQVLRVVRHAMRYSTAGQVSKG